MCIEQQICYIYFQRTLLLKLFERYGLLLCLPRDPWTTGLTETHAYILYKHLPFYPPIDVVSYYLLQC